MAPREAAPGTGVIRGRITSLDTGKPLRRAQVHLTPADELVPPPPRTASTSSDGRYEFRDIAPGRYTLRVQRSGYLTLTYGQRRPSEQGRPLEIADKEVAEKVDFALPRMSVISGRVLDDLDEPIGRVQSDGSFEVQGVLRHTVLSIGPLSGDWTLKGIELEGRDIADLPLPVEHGKTLSGVRVVLTRRPTTIRGALRDEKQNPAEGTVIVFADDGAKWREGSRSVRATRLDQRGLFTFKGLPAGDYLLVALDSVQDGQWHGEPIANAHVGAMQFRYFQGTRKLVPVGATATGLGSTAHTDESGQYLLMLPPGDFVVMGQLRETWRLEGDPAQIFGYAPSFYPGVMAAADAQRIKVASGQEAGNIDFALVPARTSRVSGTVFNAAGMPLAGESVSLSWLVGGPELNSIIPSSHTARTGPDGRFSLNHVPAAEYVLTVLTGAVNDQPPQEARQMIEVAGADIQDLVVVTGSGGTLRGHIVSDDGTPVPGVERLAVRARSLTPVPWMSKLGSAGNGRVNADGTFELKWLWGPVVLSIGTLAGDWTLKAVEVNGRNVADDPIEVRHGETLNGVRFVLTTRPTHVRGGLLDEKQQPAEGTVVIFPEDASRWREESRTVRAARPDQKGEFSFKGLPVGKYLIAAVDYVQDGQWYDPEFLAELRPRAERLSLGEAESKRIDLTVRK